MFLSCICTIWCLSGHLTHLFHFLIAPCLQYRCGPCGDFTMSAPEMVSTSRHKLTTNFVQCKNGWTSQRQPLWTFLKEVLKHLTVFIISLISTLNVYFTEFFFVCFSIISSTRQNKFHGHTMSLLWLGWYSSRHVFNGMTWNHASHFYYFIWLLLQ